MRGRRRSSLSAFQTTLVSTLRNSLTRVNHITARTFVLFTRLDKIVFFSSPLDTVKEGGSGARPLRALKRRLFQVVSADVPRHQTPFEN